jgi:hypothetical protein
MAERRPGQGLHEFCTPLRIAREHGYEYYNKTPPGEKSQYCVDFEDEETYIMFKLRYL